MNRMQPRRFARASIGNLVPGIWVIISPFMLDFGDMEAVKWNNISVAGAIALLALARGPQGISPNVVNVLLGPWLCTVGLKRGATGLVVSQKYASAGPIELCG